jgi:hypothetical protein
VLRACRRVLRPHGRVAFYTIYIPPGLSEADYRRAVVDGPPAPTLRRHDEMLRAAGFDRIEETDVTNECARVRRALNDARDRHADALRRQEGVAEFEEAQRSKRAELLAIKDGLLRRSLFVAQRAD